MASIATDELTSAAPAMDDHNDPFITSENSPAEREPRHRYSTFNSHLFALGPNASPGQAKRALEAHLAETDRRMEEAGKLGTALVQQRKDLTERLKDVEKLQAEGELSQDLRLKLVEIEKDYNDVARESARAFLPKPRVPSNEAAAGSPFVPEGKGGRRSVSPSKFEAQATGSPTKFSVPNRKLRNQPANRIHDIEFAAEISQSLIAQVRNLQALLAEKEEELRDVKLDKSKLEYDAEGFQQRVKTLDESENRYKDENWSLETQIHELLASQRESADREKKLQQTVNLLQSEKNSAQRELDEVKLSHSKLSEDHAAAIKHHDTEIGAAKRNIVMADSEKVAMLRKIDDLTGQNQELAKAVASQRGRTSDRQEILGMSDEDFETANDNNTPEHSPPPSPVKGTPRHSLLESETIKTSLHHAQRTIQSLRNNVHREKTEKLELRRMLQDARDELEKVRSDPLGGSKRSSKTSSREFKKPPRLLGGLRSARSEIFAEDPSWEDHPESSSPTTLSQRSLSNFEPVMESTENEQFDTANETSDQGFQTANERGTDTEAFHTGAEEFSSDEDIQTETDSPTKRRTLKGRPPGLPMGLARSSSVHSTASTEDEYTFEDMRTPTSQLPALHNKFPLRVSRGAFRRSRQASEDPTFQSSPASFANSAGGTPQPVQSLAAELGDFDGSDNESNLSATPSRRASRPGSYRGTTASPPPPVPRLPKVILVDSGMMTDPLPELTRRVGHERPMSMNTVVSGLSSEYSDSGALEENLAKFPSPPTSPPKRDFSFSDVHAHEVEPVDEPNTHAADLASLKQEHAQQIEMLHAENAAAHAAALAALEASHADKISRSVDEARNAHARELEAAKSGQAEEASRAATEVAEAHARELEALQIAHMEKTAQLESKYQSTLASEMQALQTNYIQQLTSTKKEVHETHIAELAALAAAHEAQIEHAKKALTDSHANELDSLKASHAAQIDQAKQGSDAAHAVELEALKRAHLAQIEDAKSSIGEVHVRELEALKAAHSTQVDQSQQESEAVHAAAIAALITSHSTQMESSKAAGDATLGSELDAIKSIHSQQLESSKAEAATVLARELAALKATHERELESTRAEGEARFATELAVLQSAHSKALESSKAEGNANHARELEALQASHAELFQSSKAAADAALTREIESIKGSHAEELDRSNKEHVAAYAAQIESINAAHAKELEHFRNEKDTVQAAEVAALVALHTKQLSSSKSEAELTLSKKLASLKESHAQELETLKSEHAAAHAKELESFKAALAKQVESSKSEGDVAHSQQIEAMNAANVEIVEAHKRESEKALEEVSVSAKASQERQIEALKSEHAAARSKELDELVSKHDSGMDALRAEFIAVKAKELEELSSQHAHRIAVLDTEHTSSRVKELETLSSSHDKQIEALKGEAAAAKLQELQDLAASHQSQIEMFHTSASASKAKELDELAASHLSEIEALKAEASAITAKELDESNTTHANELHSLRAEHESATAKLIEELASSHALELEALRSEIEASKAKELEAYGANRDKEFDSIRAEHEASRTRELEDSKSHHAALLTALRSEHQSTLDGALENLKASHAKDTDLLHSGHLASQESALAILKSSHIQELEELRAVNDTALAKALDAAHAEHAKAFEAQCAETSAETQKLLTGHALELEALRKSMAIARPTLGYSSLSTVETEPIEEPELLRSPKREGFIIPRESEQLQTPFGKRGKGIAIAEDETRQSLSAANGPETPESQRPLKEMSTNTDARLRKRAPPAVDESSQTMLTSDGIDQLLLKSQRRASQDSFTVTTNQGEAIVTPFDDGTPSTVRHRRSQEIIGSPSRTGGKDSGLILTPAPIPFRRPGSSGSARSSQQTMPPLPANHREAIEAARTGSFSEAKGIMGPPLLPASAYKNPAARPRTPRDRPLSPQSARGTPTLRPMHTGSTQGYAEVHSPTRIPARSRQSSVTSFASEVDTRFNIRGEMGMDAAGFAGPNTDPRMIQAITQTMIGEYLWKYTRKAGRGEMSENRHRRYFWVHPYTRTLYWSDRDPSAAGRSELKAKSVPIEAVRVVTDDNPMPPGLHRKSLVIISPGRTIKFTCTTGQRHETWFNALSYLLLRTGNEGHNDAEEIAGNITQEDVDEFNPTFGRRPVNGNRRAPPSLSSYNSRTTRGYDSPNIDMSMSIPTLTPTHEKAAPRPGTLSRLSGYWKSGTSTSGGMFGSLRSRSHTAHNLGSAIYEASEVNDSAEELRQMIEQQDRESDRLENVRACCDGKHDVGTLSHSSKRHGHGHSHSHSHTHPGQSTTPTPMSTLRLRAA